MSADLLRPCQAGHSGIRPALQRLIPASTAEHRDVLLAKLEEARRYTLRFLERIDQVDPGLFFRATHPDFSPVGWHFGHIAAFSGLWILQRLAGQRALDPGLDRIFMPDSNPKLNRSLLPSRNEVLEFLAETSRRIAAVLRTTDLEAPDPLAHRGVLFWNIVQHEYQHGETMAVVLSLYQPPGPESGGQGPDFSGWGAESEEYGPTPQVTVPGGCFIQGTDAPWVYDNERPAHHLELPSFRMDVYPVTNGQFRAFMADGGYRRPELWTGPGWELVCAGGLEAPGGWRLHPRGGWMGRGLLRSEPLRSDGPVAGVSWYEADAYARWAGRALPEEAEWERAASWAPQGQRTYPWGEEEGGGASCDLEHPYGGSEESRSAGGSALGCLALGGGVWEWTSSEFRPYPGFRPFPYEGYSMPWFGDHKVLRGGAWTTRPLLLRTTFRNWYLPSCREIHSGIRCISRA